MARTNSRDRFRSARLLATAALLLAVLPALGFALLRLSSDSSREGGSAEAESPVVVSGISEEVVQSVLSRPDQGAQQGDSAAPTAGTTSSRLKILQDGAPLAIENGQAVRLGDDLFVEIFVAPYPPTDFEADVDFYLTNAAGEPVGDAEVDVIYDMMFMNHGPFQAVPKEIGVGHYVATYITFMFGPWVLDAYFTAPGSERSHSLSLSIYVWPQ